MLGGEERGDADVARGSLMVSRFTDRVPTPLDRVQSPGSTRLQWFS